ncbi:hypothetical protein GY45DRAFT_1350583 [Cubamyces sp. BRFM 1775]|nr:hypothetical protein GY45DRAFT_1350583 [Cubamyces sp. BRFM 1775]
MSFSGFDDIPQWGAPTPTNEDIVTNAIKKEKVIKWGNCGCSGGLAGLVPKFLVMMPSANEPKAMLAKTKGVQSDIDKLVSGNETLQMYIDNLTMQMAKRRGQ